MRYTKTQPNQYVAEKKPCKSCDKPTLFKSSVLPGMRICPECDPKVRERKIWHEAHERNARNKRSYKATQQRNGRGSNQFQIRNRSERHALTVLIVLLLSILLFTMLQAILSPRLDDKFLNRGAEASFISPVASASAVPATPPPSDVLAGSPDGEVADFIRRVHMLESTAGRNTNPNALHNKCRAQNKENPYGYGGMRLMICFDTLEEATARVERWYREHRATRTEAQTYCYYAYGLNQDDCAYWRKAQTI